MEFQFGSFYSLAARKCMAGILAVAFLTGAARSEVPLSWDSTGHVVVPAMVNGQGPFEFILDTGADESAVYFWFAGGNRRPPGNARRRWQRHQPSRCRYAARSGGWGKARWR